MSENILKLAILNGLQLHLQNFDRQKEPKTLDDVISAARIAEFTIPAKKDTDATLHTKLDKIMQSIEDSKTTTALELQEDSPKPKPVSFGNPLSGQQNFSEERDFKQPNMASENKGQFTQPFYSPFQCNYQFRARMSNFQFRQCEPIKACPVMSSQPGKCVRCGLGHYPNINCCSASNRFCWRCSRRGHFARVCHTRIGVPHGSCFPRSQPQRYMARKLQNTIIHQPMQ